MEASQFKENLNQSDLDRESTQLYSALLTDPPRRGWWGSAVIAVLIHVGLFMIVLPETKVETAQEQKRTVNIQRPKIPPPPKMQKPQEVQKFVKKQKKMVIPDPDPDEPEPIKEPEPTDDPDLNLDVNFDLEQVVTANTAGFKEPILVNQIKPEFPDIAKRANIAEARVKVLLTVGANGRVKDVSWLEGLDIYKDAVIQAVKQWEFAPATLNDEPVEYTWPQTFVFKLI